MEERYAWYLARSSGLVGLAVLSASMIFGLWMAGRFAKKVTPPDWTADFHRFLGGLSVVFVTIHLVALFIDTRVEYSIDDLLVPGNNSAHPMALGLGIAALYLLLSVEITSLLMRKLPRKVWKWIHRTSFLMFVLAVSHGLAIGADTAKPIFRRVAVAVTILLLGLIPLRAVVPRITKKRRAARNKFRLGSPIDLTSTEISKTAKSPDN